MLNGKSDSGDDIRLVADDAWAQGPGPRLEDHNRLDPGLRAAIALIDNGDWDQLQRRTGIRRQKARGAVAHFPLLIEFDWPDKRISSETALAWWNALGLKIDAGYFSGRPPWYVAYGLPVHADAPGRIAYDRPARRGTARPQTVRELIVTLLNDTKGFVTRVELPGAAQAFNADAIGDMGATGPVHVPGQKASVDGAGVVIGIIDDGCAFAHPNFVRWAGKGSMPTSRLLHLWDQGRTDPAGGAWIQAQNFTSMGRELTGTAIDAVLAKHADPQTGLVDEDAVYRELGHALPDLAAHGTHVMDIAAGNGRAPMSTPGVAPDADLIFVQLPASSVASGGGALDLAIVAGVQYIFDRAGSRPVVINVSFGGHAGPHNGRSFVERTIDGLLADPLKPNRSVVVSAGNAFEADCHARGTLPDSKGNTTRTLRWVVKAEDPTENTLEVWYDAGAQLDVSLTTPSGTVLGPVSSGTTPSNLLATDGAGNATLIGTLDHQTAASPAGLSLIKIILNPTRPPAGSTTTAPAPAGTWLVRLQHKGAAAARFDAWIERDVSAMPGGARRLQSRFHHDDAEVRGTLASYATGKRSIAVGGYNTATQQIARYSACGPTRDGRRKPDLVAPAEEDAAGRGILCASSRSALPSRMNGTSAAAPQVTGLVALILQAAKDTGRSLTAAKIRDLVNGGARDASATRKALDGNAHVGADRHRRIKQDAVKAGLTGHGRPNLPASLQRLSKLP